VRHCRMDYHIVVRHDHIVVHHFVAQHCVEVGIAPCAAAPVVLHTLVVAAAA